MTVPSKNASHLFLRPAVDLSSREDIRMTSDSRWLRTFDSMDARSWAGLIPAIHLTVGSDLPDFFRIGSLMFCGPKAQDVWDSPSIEFLPVVVEHQGQTRHDYALMHPLVGVSFIDRSRSKELVIDEFGCIDDFDSLEVDSSKLEGVDIAWAPDAYHLLVAFSDELVAKSAGLTGCRFVPISSWDRSSAWTID